MRESCDYKHIVDQIRAILAAPDAADPDLVREVSAEYSEACEEVNVRLREVRDLLQKGLRSEALQLSVHSPDLLESVATLDFIERPEWESLLKERCMAVPPPLLLDVAADLNEACAHDSPEGDFHLLLRKHRLLALARAPLQNRIHVLCRIRSRDLDSPAWYEDLKSLEAARLKEIETMAQRAHRDDLVDELWSLREEMNADNWIISVPQHVKDRVGRWHQVAAAKQARQELESVVEELEAILRDQGSNWTVYGSVESGRYWRTEWNKLAAIANLTNDDPLSERAGPALDWLAAIDRAEADHAHYDQCVADLERGLNAGVVLEVLQRCYTRLLEHGEPPEDLVDRYQKRLRALRFARLRKQVVTVVAATLAVLVVATLVAFFAWRSHISHAAEREAQNLKDLISTRRFDEAQRLYEDLSDALKRHPGLQEQRRLFEAAMRKEENRRADLNRYLASADQALERATVTGSVASVDHALAYAQRLLTNPKRETQEAADIDERTTRRNEIVSRFEQDFRDRLGKFQRRLDGIRSVLHQRDFADSKSRAEALQMDIAEWLSTARQRTIDPSDRSKADEIELQATEEIKHIAVLHRKETIVREITLTAGDVDLFQAALEKLIRSEGFPEDNIDNQVLDENNLWRAAEAWRQLLSDPALCSQELLSPDMASRVLERATQLMGENPFPELTETFRVKQAHFETVANRGHGGTSLVHKAYEDLLHAVWLRENLWAITSTSGTFYTVGDPTPEYDQGLKRDVITNRLRFINGQWTHPVRSPDTNFIAAARDPTRRRRAPQSEAAVYATTRLEALKSDPSTWESAFCDILVNVQQKEGMDPIPKYIMVSTLLDVGTEGSGILAAIAVPARVQLIKDVVETQIDWASPEANEKADPQRKIAQQVLRGLPDFSKWESEVEKRLQEVFGPPELYTWTGWLGPNLFPPEPWAYYASASAPAQGELFVLVANEDGDGAEFMPIGTLIGGNVEWNTDDESLLNIGRPVYLRSGLHKQPTHVASYEPN